jgi:hypothetical protein
MAVKYVKIETYEIEFFKYIVGRSRRAKGLAFPGRLICM